LQREQSDEDFTRQTEVYGECSKFAILCAKLLKNEVETEDWSDVVHFCVLAANWLFPNTRVEPTPVSTQVHFQPKEAKKKKKKKKKA